MGLNGVWCEICAKYLAFGTYPTSAVGALKVLRARKAPPNSIPVFRVAGFLE